MKATPVGVDIAKNLMQLCRIDPISGKTVNRTLRRQAFLQHFAMRAPCLIGMEACGGSQHWARELMHMGHQVRLMPARRPAGDDVTGKTVVRCNLQGNSGATNPSCE